MVYQPVKNGYKVTIGQRIGNYSNMLKNKRLRCAFKTRPHGKSRYEKRLRCGQNATKLEFFPNYTVDGPYILFEASWYTNNASPKINFCVKNIVVRFFMKRPNNSYCIPFFLGIQPMH